MTRLVRVVMAGVALAAALSSAACGDAAATAPGIDGKAIKRLPDGLVPPTLAGLTVTVEDPSKTLAAYKSTYLEALSLYSLRTGPKLQATLEVARFTDAATKVKGFRKDVVSQIGGAIPRTQRYGRDTIYLTKATRQRVAIWFRGRYLLILSTREEFERPRTLLRSALEIKPR